MESGWKVEKKNKEKGKKDEEKNRGRKGKERTTEEERRAGIQKQASAGRLIVPGMETGVISSIWWISAAVTSNHLARHFPLRSVPLDTRLTFSFKSFFLSFSFPLFLSVSFALAIQSRLEQLAPSPFRRCEQRGIQRCESIELTRNFFEETYHAKWRHLRDANSCLPRRDTNSRNNDPRYHVEDDVSASRRTPQRVQLQIEGREIHVPFNWTFKFSRKFAARLTRKRTVFHVEDGFM